MRHPHTQRNDKVSGIDNAKPDKTNRLSRISRREFFLVGGAACAGLLAGCSGDRSTERTISEPISLAANRECDVCGMVISEHPGPSGQIFYRNNSPEGHDNPARFDSPKACMFPYYFEREQRDWTAEAVYVTDYSKVEYEISSVEEQRYIQTATAPETFSNAEDVVFVVGSKVHGAMGPDFIPFSEEKDSSAFADEFGGRTVTTDEITLEMLG
jgi:copper chaperone NosL